jgi:cell division control protein 6
MEDPEKLLEKSLGKIKQETGIIKDFSVFELDAKPRRVFVREEMKQIINYLAYYLISKVPESVLVLGFRGTGKTASVLASVDAARNKGGGMVFYVNMREARTMNEVYGVFTGKTGRGLSSSELLTEITKLCASPPSFVVLDEADFAFPKMLDDLLYSLTRRTKAFVIMVSQDLHLFEKLSDSVRSSLQPHVLFFREYTQEELYEILKLRAEDGLTEWDDTALRLLSALVTKDYRGDARVAIRALYYTAKWGKGWGSDVVENAVKEAVKDIERDTVNRLSVRDLITLLSVVEAEDTASAYSKASEMLSKIGFSNSKPTFFRTLSYLQSLGLIVLVKKKVNKTYTFEAKSLLSDPSIVREALERALV